MTTPNTGAGRAKRRAGAPLGGGRDERAEPILPSRDLAETRAFYERLGFTPWFRGETHADYEIVSRGHLVVHFFSKPDVAPYESDAGCYWRVTDADRLHAEFATLGLPRQGIPRLTAPQDTPWGMREFALVDPSGNLVRVGHELAPSHAPERS